MKTVASIVTANRGALVVTLLLAARIACADPSWAQSVLVPATSIWKYSDSGLDLGTDWRAPGHDDSGWASGPGILGYGESYIATVVSYGPDPGSRYPTTYFRIGFQVTEDPASFRSLLLRANYDDGFVAYLNGTEVVRRALPAGAISYETLATSHEGGAYEIIDLGAFIGLLGPGTNVMAVEVHQTTPSSSDLVMDMELVASDLPAILTRGPYLQNGSPGAVSIRWRTDHVTDSSVRYGPAPGSLSSEVSDAAQVVDHEVRLSGLAPGTRYYYSVGTSAETLAGDDSLHTFVTPPVAGTRQPTRIWVIGDSGLPGANQLAVRDAYDAFTGTTPTDLWLMLGDNAYATGTDAEYQAAVFEAYPAMLRTSVLWPTRGNHDLLHSGAANDYYEIFTMPTAGEAGGIASGTESYYSFDHGNIHFICLDSYGSDRSPGSAMLTWLAADLAATARDWVIAFWHHPPYSKGSHDSDTEIALVEMRENVLPILESGGVDLVLGGHSHSYERSVLLDEHYGDSGTLADSMKLDAGDGSLTGDGAYTKATVGRAPHQGAVYAVAGSSSRTSGGSLDHPVMIRSLNVLGSLVIDVDGDQLDATFIDDQGVIRDDFTIVKGVSTGLAGDIVPGGASPDGGAGRLLRARPNPLRAATRLGFTLGERGPARLEIFDAEGRRVATLVDGVLGAGRHEAEWTGHDGRGRPVSPGLYFGRLTTRGEVQMEKILLVQ